MKFLNSTEIKGALVTNAVIQDNRLTTGNKQVINASSSIIYVGNPATNLTLESSSNPTANVAGKSYAIYHAGNLQPSVSGNAGTATKLQNIRTINGTNFDGSASITTTKWGSARTVALGGDLSGSASIDGGSNVTINATARQVCFVGSDVDGSSGWYKVASQTMNGYGDTNITFMVTSTYANYFSGILQIQMRADSTSISCPRLIWLTRNGFSTNHFVVTISGMTWTLYAHQSVGRYGRLAFEVISKSDITSKNANFTLHDSTTKEATTPTATVTSSDGATVGTANRLTTARQINGTNFDGNSNITTANWGTTRTLTVGNTGKSVNGSGNVSWSLSEIGAAAASHTHSYLPLTGGTLTGNIVTNSSIGFNSGGVNMTLGLDGNYLLLSGRQLTHNDGNIQRFQTKTAGGTLYTEWYTDSKGTTRSAWMGYGTANSKHFAISVENGGQLHLSGSDGVVMKSHLNMETRAIHNVWKITGMYNNGTIIADHNNKNIEVNALGATLFLGHSTTTGVQVSSAFYTQSDSFLKGNVRYTGSNYGDNYIMMAGTGDGIDYTKCNVRMRLHYGLGFATNDGATVNCVIDSRGGRFIGKSAYWHNSSKSLKSDVRTIVSEKEPMVARMYSYDTIDTKVTMEMIEDFLDTINIKTYISDYAQEGITQDEHDDSKGHIKQLGYIADEFSEHPLFPYIGEMIGGYHAINTTALVSTLIAGYQSEKTKRLLLEDKTAQLEARIAKLEQLILT